MVSKSGQDRVPGISTRPRIQAVLRTGVQGAILAVGKFSPHAHAADHARETQAGLLDTISIEKTRLLGHTGPIRLQSLDTQFRGVIIEFPIIETEGGLNRLDVPSRPYPPIPTLLGGFRIDNLSLIRGEGAQNGGITESSGIRRWCTINKFLYNKCLTSGISA